MIHARPRATMRLQLHKGFTFNDARALVPYFVNLGISHLYASPILTAVSGSIHGYDVIDPTQVNHELGGEGGLRDLVKDLRTAGLGLIVDIVPNHMAVGGSQNLWWADVLRYGKSSRFAKFFDIEWDSANPVLKGKVLAPFLGSSYGYALCNGDIKLTRDPAGNPIIAYFDNYFPINPSDYAHIDEIGLESFSPAHASGRELLHQLLERQHYRLAWWGTAGDEINWRRFFDINGLAGLRTELPEVFRETHSTLFRLYTEGLIDGFRIDHVDGLADPRGYCRSLRDKLTELAPLRPSSAAQGPAYIIVEKILGPGEELPSDWGIDGTSGYDFMNDVSAVQHDSRSQCALQQLWHDLTHRPACFKAEELAARRQILDLSFDAQLHSVAVSLYHIAAADIRTRDTSLQAIRRGLTELLAHFPVYRTYGTGMQRSGYDKIAFDTALNEARQHAPSSLMPVLEQLDLWLGGTSDDDELHKIAQTRFQQLSAPIAAKAVEDTAFYRYGRLLSRNDVGFDAVRLGCSVNDFHRTCMRRQARFPNAMVATATHDHKRGEDLRARLAVLSELSDEWSELVRRCMAIEAERPDAGDEIMLYQMIVGAWPLDLLPSDIKGCRLFAERLTRWQQKALREAKLRTSWATPNDEYERLAATFLSRVFELDGPFIPIIYPFVERIAPSGAVNSLVQTMLKMTVPGVPDFFQGTDFWDFSLVDPDNRQPVDFSLRHAAVAARSEPHGLLASWRDGRIKQSVIHAVLQLRRNMPGVFAQGDYTPLPVTGPGASNIIAFARRDTLGSVMVVLPRLVSEFASSSSGLYLNIGALQAAAVTLPDCMRETEWRSLFTGAKVVDADRLTVEQLFAQFPLSVLVSV